MGNHMHIRTAACSQDAVVRVAWLRGGACVWDLAVATLRSCCAWQCLGIRGACERSWVRVAPAKRAWAVWRMCQPHPDSLCLPMHPHYAELVPVLLAICQEHPSPLARQRTAALLLNLIRKPNAAQRDMIAAACARLAHCVGPARTALELLPHIADQATHE